MNHFTRDTRNALDAKQEAQRIAFAPFVFQAARAMRDLGLLAALDAAGDAGLRLPELQAHVGLSRYATRVLAEAGLGIGAMTLSDAVFRLTKLGWYLQNDAMTRVNMDFSHDVNYQGLFYLQDSLREGRPAGLKTLNPFANTFYEALSTLPEHVRESWLGFDHFIRTIHSKPCCRIFFPKRLAACSTWGAIPGNGHWPVPNTTRM